MKKSVAQWSSNFSLILIFSVSEDRALLLVVELSSESWHLLSANNFANFAAKINIIENFSFEIYCTIYV